MKLSLILSAAALSLSGCATKAEPAQAPLSASQAGLLAALSGKSSLSDDKIAALEEAAQAYPLGSEQNPVRAHMPPGQRAYLSKLRCENNQRPTFMRAGSAGLSVYQSIMDIYIVKCDGSEPEEAQVYMDMYHPGHDETKPVPGFTIDLGPFDASAAESDV